jgi:hypothetical protein
MQFVAANPGGEYNPGLGMDTYTQGSSARRLARVVALCLPLCLPLLAACGKSSEEIEREKAAHEAAVQKAIEESLAEERAKDQRMREAAAVQAGEHVERNTAQFEEERERIAAAQPAPEPVQPDPAEALRKYTERLHQSVVDPASLQLRNAELSPKRNGMCAEFNAREKNGNYAGFKRVVVTDTAVNAEEPPNGDTLSYFLAFQVAARDTGCFPDVQKVHVLR